MCSLVAVALVDARGNYVLNGNFVVSAFHKELHVSGTILEYSGSGTVVERINGTGMIYEDIYVHVCSEVLYTLSSFYPRDTMYSAVFATATCLSICPSVCLSHAGVVPNRAKTGS